MTSRPVPCHFAAPAKLAEFLALTTATPPGRNQDSRGQPLSAIQQVLDRCATAPGAQPGRILRYALPAREGGISQNNDFDLRTRLGISRPKPNLGDQEVGKHEALMEIETMDDPARGMLAGGGRGSGSAKPTAGTTAKACLSGFCS